MAYAPPVMCSAMWRAPIAARRFLRNLTARAGGSWPTAALLADPSPRWAKWN